MTGSRKDKLLERKAQIEAQLKQLEARECQQWRKDDTRRKIIAGALALEHAEIDAEFGAKMRDLIARYVTKPNERQLFGLDPLADSSQESTSPADAMNSAAHG